MRKKMLIMVLCSVLIGSAQALIPQVQSFNGNHGDPMPAGWDWYITPIDYDGAGSLDMSISGEDAGRVFYTTDIGTGDYQMHVKFKDVSFDPGGLRDQTIQIEFYGHATDFVSFKLLGGAGGGGTALFWDAYSWSAGPVEGVDYWIPTTYTSATIGTIVTVDFNIEWVEDVPPPPTNSGTITVDIVLNAGLPSEVTLGPKSFTADSDYPVDAKQLNITTGAFDASGTAPFGVKLDYFALASRYVANPVSPVDEAIYIDKSTESLVWDAPPAAYVPSGYDLYVSTDPNISVSATNVVEITDGSAVSPYALSSLGFGTTYYWRVDAKDGPTIYEGLVWSFTTKPIVPTVVTQPEGQVRGPANEKLDSSITIVGINGEGYQWYKDGGDGLNDLADDTLVTGQTTNTLAITGVTLGDEGEYFCVITHSVKPDAASDLAYLEYARLTGRWDFEDNLNDTVGTNHGTWSGAGGAAAYDTGIVGTKAIDFGTGDPNSVSVPVAAVPANGKEMSVSLWAKNGPMQGSGLIPFAVRDNAGGPVFLAAVPWFNSTVYFNAGDPINAGINQVAYVVSNDDLEGVWNHWVFTCNSEDGYMAIYRNGVVVSSYSGVLGNDIFGATDFDIGSEANSPASYYQGMLDDFRVYNYAIDAVEAAYLYTDVSGTTVCAGDAGVFDVTGAGDEPDCKVGILDFAKFAAFWLNCNLVPDCLPRP